MRVFTSERFAEHTTPPGHPERPERAEVFADVAREFRAEGGDVIEPRAATRDEAARVHTSSHLDGLEGVRGRAAKLDEDTFTSPESVEIAYLAAGAAIDAARHAWRTGEPTLAMVRPPGHHAERDRAMGFCFLNNIAIAAAALRADGVSRIAIVDIDVHHGNGTQDVFYADPSVLFISTHQWPLYPGTGAADEIGHAQGRGFTLNIPLPAGTRDDVYLAAYREQVLPALESFAPEIILVSAGFDAHARDPLAQMRLSTEGYAAITALLDDAAARICGRRIALISEGGYHLEALRDCLTATIAVLRRNLN